MKKIQQTGVSHFESGIWLVNTEAQLDDNNLQ